jgi:YgiT-type zinc finger domain-containing protein
MPTKNTMICDLCGKKGTRERRITRSYGRGSNLLVIEQIPVITCPHCGESYLTAVTLHELEKIKRHRRELAAKRPVAVANFR